MQDIEETAKLSLPEPHLYQDDGGSRHIVYWSDVKVSDSFSVTQMKRDFHIKQANAHMITIEHKRGWWEKWGGYVGIGLAALGAILAGIGIYLIYHPPPIPK